MGDVSNLDEQYADWMEVLDAIRRLDADRLSQLAAHAKQLIAELNT